MDPVIQIVKWELWVGRFWIFLKEDEAPVIWKNRSCVNQYSSITLNLLFGEVDKTLGNC